VHTPTAAQPASFTTRFAAPAFPCEQQVTHWLLFQPNVHECLTKP